MNIVRCSFYLRRPAEGGYRYQAISLKSYGNDGALHTEHPPLVGDLVPIYDLRTESALTVRVVARQWGHNQYGSVNWPITETRPVAPDMLDIVVEEAAGIFHDEAPLTNDEDE